MWQPFTPYFNSDFPLPLMATGFKPIDLFPVLIPAHGELVERESNSKWGRKHLEKE
jgi:hypothetical protein